MKKMKKSTITLLTTLLFVSSAMIAGSSMEKHQPEILVDYDPLVDIEVTVEIQTIRSFEKRDRQLHFEEEIDKNSDPDFQIRLLINDEEFLSPVWEEAKYVYESWSATLNVPDDEELVDVVIQLWDIGDEPLQQDRLCDISGDSGITQDAYDVELVYNVKTGHWYGDDFLSDSVTECDPSGYGRLNGCDDGTIYKQDRDCELYFSIYQNDYDTDQIPYWTEVNDYGTNPEIDDTGRDDDNDDIPIEWEWHWGYDPFTADEHDHLDPEVDGINNLEEYLTRQWRSDPFRKDIFTQMDYMETAPDGTVCTLPEESKELLYTAWNRQNIVYHLDDGSRPDSQTNEVPYDESTDWDELDSIYRNYFLENQESWRLGVFHYGVVIYQSSWVNGNAFGSNRFQISAHGMEEKSRSPILNRFEVYASAYMHETGHTLGFWPIPGHNDRSKYPWQIGWWLVRPYKSCMNYGYMYYTVDYSDGSRMSPNDYNDWERLDLTYFERGWD